LEPTREPHNIALGRAIRQLRKDVKLTQGELADRAQVPVTELSRIESGEVDAEWGTLRHLAYSLGVDLADLFRLAEKQESRGGPVE
jgi:transcriptional regulator with XRE-family HTH domain